jgi:hypothetical protein
MILSRAEFIDYFRGLDYRIDGNDPFCPLWVPEEDGNINCQWFVAVKPLSVHKIKSSYYDWCNQTLKGSIRCFSSSLEEQQEWWGFTEHKDVVVWMLKWS